MKISIIIPYFNAERYILTMLNSICRQGLALSDYEVIVIDDGSTNSLESVTSFCNQRANFHLFSNKHGGVSSARNYGLSVARGEYLFFCDADDKLVENSLCEVYEDAHKRCLDMLFFNRFITDEDGTKSPQHSPEYYINEIVRTGKDFYGRHPRIPTGPWHYLIRRDFIEEHNLAFPEGIRYVEDVSFLYDALAVANRVSGIDKDVYLWIQRDGSITHTKNANTIASKCDFWLWSIKRESSFMLNESNMEYSRAIRNRICSHSFILLYNSFSYLAPKYSRYYIQELKSIGLYPFEYGEFFRPSARPKYLLLHALMNKQGLWMFCCKIMAIIRNLRG